MPGTFNEVLRVQIPAIIHDLKEIAKKCTTQKAMFIKSIEKL